MTARRNIRHGALALAAVLVVAWLAPAGHAQDAVKRRGFSITITEPKNQEPALGRTRITADVEIDNPSDLERVEFLVGDKVIFVDKEAPWECFYDFGEEAKSWIIRAVAYHAEGVSVSDAVITRRLDIAYVEEVNRVLLWATVTDKKDRFILDLTRDDFRILEDGAPQKILEFYPDQRPITMAILIDTSGSMRDQMEEVHDAAGSFVETLRPEDKALVIDFDDKVFLIQDLTSDQEALKESIESTEALGATSIYDALHAAFRKLRDIKGRKAIVLLSDGEDSSSQFGYERVLEEAKTHNVIIFGIGLGGGFLDGARRSVLREFANATGGRSFFVKKAEELAGIYQRIADELRHQYYLTYSTDNDAWDGRWIEIEVACDTPGTKVRYRPGFFAVRGAALR